MKGLLPVHFLHMYINLSEEGECTEYFDYAAGLCIMSEEEKNNLLVDQDNVIDRTYKGISEIACERMCTTMYDLTCSGVFYTRWENTSGPFY